MNTKIPTFRKPTLHRVFSLMSALLQAPQRPESVCPLLPAHTQASAKERSAEHTSLAWKGRTAASEGAAATDRGVTTTRVTTVWSPHPSCSAHLTVCHTPLGNREDLTTSSGKKGKTKALASTNLQHHTKGESTFHRQSSRGDLHGRRALGKAPCGGTSV